jgi:hypothetical protein
VPLIRESRAASSVSGVKTSPVMMASAKLFFACRAASFVSAGSSFPFRDPSTMLLWCEEAKLTHGLSLETYIFGAAILAMKIKQLPKLGSDRTSSKDPKQVVAAECEAVRL